MDYKEHYIAFLDIIGFSDIMENDEENAQKIISLLHYWYDQIPSLEQINFPNKLKFKSISDSIIIYTKKDGTNLNNFLHLIGYLQADFLKECILIRGAISIGEIYEDKKLDILLGKGIIKAYKLEKIANFPRVIIDPKIILESSYNNQEFCVNNGRIKIRQSGAMVFNFNLLKTTDIGIDKMKYIHLDYTKLFIAEQFSFSANLDYPPDFKSSYEFIKDSLYNKQVSIEKYNWLAKEFSDSFRHFTKGSNFENCDVKEKYRDELNLYLSLYSGL